MSLEAITQLHGWSHDTFTNASSGKFLRVESCYPERFGFYASLYSAVRATSISVGIFSIDVVVNVVLCLFVRTEEILPRSDSYSSLLSIFSSSNAD